MENKKTSVFANSMIWFGAAISIAEITTGVYIAPLGFKKGLAAILLGHFIGCVLLYLAGVIGGTREKSSMESVKISFGEKGGILFAALNILQLVGWTAVMIQLGANSAGLIALSGVKWVWSLIIAALIIVWILIGIRNLEKVNILAIGLLFVLTIVLSFLVFSNGNAKTPFLEGISFGAAVELSVSMPLSWLPLISDYTREAKNPKKASLASSAVYFAASSWMYIIGMSAAIFTGEAEVAKIMTAAGLGILGVLIIILSTVTTTFMDAFSAGVSANSVTSKIGEKPFGIAVCIIGAMAAIFVPSSFYMDFLYMIGSVFAPMISVMIADVFILKKDSSKKEADIISLATWLAGFVLYRILLLLDSDGSGITFIGDTLPVMLFTILLAVVINKAADLIKAKRKNV